MKLKCILLAVLFSAAVYQLNAQKTYVPDDHFEQALIDLGYDSGPLDDSVQTANISSVTKLDIPRRQITSLKGIEDFRSLELLSCWQNQLTSLDVSSNSMLKVLTCFENKLTSLDVSSNLLLESLNCDNNQLTGIDVSLNLNLKVLGISFNNLTSLDVKSNTELTYLTIEDNSISDLDISNNRKLEILRVYKNGISQLDVKHLAQLRELGCLSNKISNLDLTNNIFLQFLTCGNNLLTELNLSNNPLLYDVYCPVNQIKTLTLGVKPQMYRLLCFQNNIEELDVSKCPKLTSFDCHQNNLSSLNVKNGNNSNMTSNDSSGDRMYAYNNPNLFCIDVDDPAAATTYANWQKDAQASYSTDCARFNQRTYVPDDHFEQALIDWGYDSGPLDDYVLTANISSVKNLSVHYRGITSLEGIQDFVSLENLNCEFNNLTSLDLTSNTSLMYLYCGGNNITSLNLSTDSELKYVVAYLNQLNQIDVSACKHLLGLEVGQNNLTSLDITNNTELQYLRCDSNYLSVLDVSANNKLERLTCKHNILTEIDLSNLLKLRYLDCSENDLTSLDVSGIVSLYSLYCSQNDLSSLNLKNGNNQNMYFNALDNPNLFCIEVDDPVAAATKTFWYKDAQATYTADCARFNQRTYIPDDNFEQALIDRGLDSGPLDDYVRTMSIDTVMFLYVQGKGIENMEGLQDFISLGDLDCSNNHLTKLNLAGKSNLWHLYCANNDLTNLDLSSNSNLTVLSCEGNMISNLDLSLNQLLYNVKCSDNALTSLNIKNGACSMLSAENNPDLFCIEVDDPCGAGKSPNWQKDEQAGYSSDCARSAINFDYHTACEAYTWIDGKTYTESNHTAKYNLQSSSGCDSIVTLGLSILKTFGTDTQTACNSFTWIDGKTYTESNHTAIDTLINEAGCDSIVTLDLTINRSSYGTLQQTGCESYTWIDGKTYTENNNTATYNYINDEGCPSVATLDLTISHPTFGTDVQTACDSLIWIDGKTYKEDNHTATYALKSASGCDSIVTLNLIVLHSSVGTDVQKACDSLVWIDGKTYTEDNHTATFVLTNAAGCDSTVTLDLTVSHSPFSIDVRTVCDSLIWIDGKTYKESNHTATYAYPRAEGCDSIVKLDLTVNHSTFRNDVHTACDVFTWIDGKTYTESNHAATYTLTNASGCDSVIMLDLTVNDSWSVTDVQNGCDAFTWIDGKTYTESNNTASYLLTTKAGCDSLVTLDLTINHPTFGTDVQTACDSLIWIDGKTYFESNKTATYVLTNSVGCDSVVTLNLTVKHSTSGTDVQTACGSYTWIDGKTYSESNNTATYALTNAAGCDSIVALNLILKHSSYRTDVQTACGTFTWMDGKTYTESNHTATNVLTNAEGCDSVITLDLTLNPAYSVTDVQIACDAFTWIDGNTYTESNNSATYMLNTVAGCDSLVTLDLTVNHPSYGTDFQTACDSFTWIDGHTYTESNKTATYALTNSVGCDSLVTLDLTINKIDATVTQNGSELIANQENASYQWFNCEDNFSMLIGEKKQSYIALTNSIYSVVVAKDGCVDTSAYYAVTTVGIVENDFGSRLIVYPNPTSGKVTIDLSRNYDWIGVNVYSTDGKLIASKTVTSVKQFDLNIEGDRGFYLLELVTSDQKKAILKLLKE